MLKATSGIYLILNKINNKKYIGSSTNIQNRFKKHIKEIKGGYHRNLHLQNAVNKYGLDNFDFIILEKCPINELLKKEQFYIDNHNWNDLYNITKIANSGGGDVTGKEVLLINLKGKIIKKFNSGLALANYFGRKSINYRYINTSAISKKQYRVVTPEFYSKHKKIILDWKPYSVEPDSIKKNKRQIKNKLKQINELHNII